MQSGAQEGLLAQSQAQAPAVAELGRWIATDMTGLQQALSTIGAAEAALGTLPSVFAAKPLVNVPVAGGSFFLNLPPTGTEAPVTMATRPAQQPGI
jgi:hypothetical protein